MSRMGLMSKIMSDSHQPIRLIGLIIKAVTGKASGFDSSANTVGEDCPDSFIC